jgi:hypothetical protein
MAEIEKLNKDFCILLYTNSCINLRLKNLKAGTHEQLIQRKNYETIHEKTDLILKRSMKPIFITGINITPREANLTAEEFKKTNYGYYTGWVYFYERILKYIPESEWLDGSWKQKVNLIIYTKYTEPLHNYYLKCTNPKERLAYESLKENGYIIGNKETLSTIDNGIPTLVKKCNEIGKVLTKVPRKKKGL